MNTPWGVSQGQTKVAEGIVSVWTASHGGYRLSPEREAQIPEYMRKGRWYEEDCDWVIPCLVFSKEFRDYYDREDSDERTPDRMIKSATEILKHWMPESYEKFFNVVLFPGESDMRDEFIFNMNHRSDLVAVITWGDRDVRVPAGFVGVYATRQCPVAGGYFLISSEEYYPQARGCKHFIVDEKVHKVWVDHPQIGEG